jgi:drug/metabolite transporter (DMT)-like permease
VKRDRTGIPLGAGMKLNFWQWLGVALLVVGAVLLAIKYTSNGSGPAATQPTADQRGK